jgi:hypothetical protein
LLELGSMSLPEKNFNLVFTNRCLINLNTVQLQSEAMMSMAKILKPQGHLMLAENPQHKFDKQNALRGLLDVPPRDPPDFNVLVDEGEIFNVAKKAGLRTLHQDDFSSLHDVLLYVLLPKINGGKIDYDHL